MSRNNPNVGSASGSSPTDVYVTHQFGNPDPDGAQRRQDITIRNREFVEAHFIGRGCPDVAYLLIDLARHPGDAKFFDSQWVLNCKANSTIPTAILCVPRWQLYKVVTRYQRSLHRNDASNPQVSPVVEKLAPKPPEKCIPVMVISGGKNLVFWPSGGLL